MDKPVVFRPGMKFLVVIVAGIGDFVEAVPVLRALRETYPDARISLLTSPRVFGYARSCPYVNDTISLGPGLGRIVKAVWGSRRRCFDVILNLKEIDTWRGSMLMAALFYASGAENRVGRNTCGRGWFLNLSVDEGSRESKSQSDYFADVMKLVSVEVPDVEPELWVSDLEESFAADFLAHNEIDGGDFVVGINPGSYRLTRRWFADRFAFVGDYLAREMGARVVILGGPAEVALAEKIAERMESTPVIAAGRIASVGQLAALIRRLGLLVTTNSAAMHIGGMLGVPLVGLIGAGDIHKDRPWGKKESMCLIAKDVSCNPCYKRRCRKMDCMAQITVDDVLDGIRGLVQVSGAIQ